MSNTVIKALTIVAISLGLALIFNFLFFEKLIGISVFIFNFVLLSLVFSFGRYYGMRVEKTWWLILPILFFALMPGVRANEFLTFLNICAALGLLLLLSHQLAGTPIIFMKIFDYLALALVPFRMLWSALSTVSLIGQIQSAEKNKDVWLRGLKGFIMAVPILVIFGVLFFRADLAFSKFVSDIVTITISERTLQYLAMFIFAFVISLCFLSYIFFPKKIDILPAFQESNSAPFGRSMEALVFLGLNAALFLVFIIFQITYLFGGEANIVNEGFTYAEYARRGFWELLGVGLLTLVLLLAFEKYTGAEARDKRFIAPALILIAEVVIVIFSALTRLSLYIDAYSMTLLRFYVAGFILMLLVLFILLAYKFIKAKAENFFTFGMLTVIAFFVALNIVNPDPFIARYNLNQYKISGKIDALYFKELSADAEAEKVELYKQLKGDEKILFGELLAKGREKLEQSGGDWQSANLSRRQALKLLNEITLPALNGGDSQPSSTVGASPP